MDAYSLAIDGQIAQFNYIKIESEYPNLTNTSNYDKNE